MLKSSCLNQQWLQSKEASFLLAHFQHHWQMAQQPPHAMLLDSFELGKSYSVGHLHAKLLLHYTNVLLSPGLDNPDNCKITNIKIIKSASLSRHETVLFTVNGSSFFIVDRNVELSQLPRCLFSSGKQATDAIMRVHTDQLPHFGLRHIVWETDFSNYTGTTFLDLSFILLAVSQFSGTYNVLKHNCLWYSQTIQTMVLRQYPLNPIIHWSSSGNWFRIKSFNPTLEELENIIELASDHSDDFRGRVSESSVVEKTEYSSPDCIRGKRLEHISQLWALHLELVAYNGSMSY